MTPLQEKKAGEDLAKAAAYLREHGWQQHAMGGFGEPACLYGALREVVQQYALRHDRAVDLLQARIKACFPRSHGARDENIIIFNDVRTRKLADVLQVLEGGCE